MRTLPSNFKIYKNFLSYNERSVPMFMYEFNTLLVFVMSLNYRDQIKLKNPSLFNVAFNSENSHKSQITESNE